MNVRPFLDSNVLVYAVTDEFPRRAVAREIIADGGVISVQVLNEFVNVARKKLRQSWPQVETALEQFLRLLDPPLALTVSIHEAAVELAKAHRFSFYDALIVAAARQAGCTLLLTEDMADGTTIAGVTIRNPFRTH